MLFNLIEMPLWLTRLVLLVPHTIFFFFTVRSIFLDARKEEERAVHLNTFQSINFRILKMEAVVQQMLKSLMILNLGFIIGTIILGSPETPLVIFLLPITLMILVLCINGRRNSKHPLYAEGLLHLAMTIFAGTAGFILFYAFSPEPMASIIGFILFSIIGLIAPSVLYSRLPTTPKNATF